MAIYFPEKRAVWLHIPKTGGMWLRNTLLQSGLPVIGLDDDTHPQLHMHCLRHEVPYPVEQVLAFVRHPLSWYASWWRYQAANWESCVQPPWHPQRCLAETCRDDNFSGFVRKCLRYQPTYVSRLYEWYLGPPSMQPAFVGRYEHLQQDVQAMIAYLGYPPINVNRPPENVSQARCGPAIWDADLAGEIIRQEQPALTRFYQHA